MRKEEQNGVNVILMRFDTYSTLAENKTRIDVYLKIARLLVCNGIQLSDLHWFSYGNTRWYESVFWESSVGMVLSEYTGKYVDWSPTLVLTESKNRQSVIHIDLPECTVTHD